MAVWIGFDAPQPLGVAASDLAAPLWGWWMNRVTRHQGDPPQYPDEPKIVHRVICTVSGKTSTLGCHGINAPFLEGTIPRTGCPLVHPPPAAPVEGEVEKPGHESLWKRLAREKAERDAAAAVPP